MSSQKLKGQRRISSSDEEDGAVSSQRLKPQKTISSSDEEDEAGAPLKSGIRRPSENHDGPPQKKKKKINPRIGPKCSLRGQKTTQKKKTNILSKKKIPQLSDKEHSDENETAQGLETKESAGGDDFLSHTSEDNNNPHNDEQDESLSPRPEKEQRNTKPRIGPKSSLKGHKTTPKKNKIFPSKKKIPQLSEEEHSDENETAPGLERKESAGGDDCLSHTSEDNNNPHNDEEDKSLSSRSEEDQRNAKPRLGPKSSLKGSKTPKKKKILPSKKKIPQLSEEEHSDENETASGLERKESAGGDDGLSHTSEDNNSPHNDEQDKSLSPRTEAEQRNSKPRIGPKSSLKGHKTTTKKKKILSSKKKILQLPEKEHSDENETTTVLKEKEPVGKDVCLPDTSEDNNKPHNDEQEESLSSRSEEKQTHSKLGIGPKSSLKEQKTVKKREKILPSRKKIPQLSEKEPSNENETFPVLDEKEPAGGDNCLYDSSVGGIKNPHNNGQEEYPSPSSEDKQSHSKAKIGPKSLLQGQKTLQNKNKLSPSKKKISQITEEEHSDENVPVLVGEKAIGGDTCLTDSSVDSKKTYNDEEKESICVNSEEKQTNSESQIGPKSLQIKEKILPHKIKIAQPEEEEHSDENKNTSVLDVKDSVEGDVCLPDTSVDSNTSHNDKQKESVSLCPEEKQTDSLLKDNEMEVAESNVVFEIENRNHIEGHGFHQNQCKDGLKKDIIGSEDCGMNDNYIQEITSKNKAEIASDIPSTVQISSFSKDQAEESFKAGNTESEVETDLNVVSENVPKTGDMNNFCKITSKSESFTVLYEAETQATTRSEQVRGCYVLIRRLEEENPEFKETLSNSKTIKLSNISDYNEETKLVGNQSQQLRISNKKSQPVISPTKKMVDINVNLFKEDKKAETECLEVSSLAMNDAKELKIQTLNSENTEQFTSNTEVLKHKETVNESAKSENTNDCQNEIKMITHHSKVLAVSDIALSQENVLSKQTHSLLEKTETNETDFETTIETEKTNHPQEENKSMTNVSKDLVILNEVIRQPIMSLETVHSEQKIIEEHTVDIKTKKETQKQTALATNDTEESKTYNEDHNHDGIVSDKIITNLGKAKPKETDDDDDYPVENVIVQTIKDKGTVSDVAQTEDCASNKQIHLIEKIQPKETVCKNTIKTEKANYSQEEITLVTNESKESGVLNQGISQPTVRLENVHYDKEIIDSKNLNINKSLGIKKEKQEEEVANDTDESKIPEEVKSQERIVSVETHPNSGKTKLKDTVSEQAIKSEHIDRESTIESKKTNYCPDKKDLTKIEEIKQVNETENRSDKNVEKPQTGNEKTEPNKNNNEKTMETKKDSEENEDLVQGQSKKPTDQDQTQARIKSQIRECYVLLKRLEEENSLYAKDKIVHKETVSEVKVGEGEEEMDVVEISDDEKVSEYESDLWYRLPARDDPVWKDRLPPPPGCEPEQSTLTPPKKIKIPKRPSCQYKVNSFLDTDKILKSVTISSGWFEVEFEINHLPKFTLDYILKRHELTDCRFSGAGGLVTIQTIGTYFPPTKQIALRLYSKKLPRKSLEKKEENILKNKKVTGDIQLQESKEADQKGLKRKKSGDSQSDTSEESKQLVKKKKETEDNQLKKSKEKNQKKKKRKEAGESQSASEGENKQLVKKKKKKETVDIQLLKIKKKVKRKKIGDDQRPATEEEKQLAKKKKLAESMQVLKKMVEKQKELVRKQTAESTTKHPLTPVSTSSKSPATRPKPLHLNVKGRQAKAIESFLNYLKKLIAEGEEAEDVKEEKVFLTLDTHVPEDFKLKKRVVGKGGANLLYIMEHTGAEVTLRGITSGYKEATGLVSPQQLHLRIRHNTPEKFTLARSLAANLMDSVDKEFKEFCNMKWQNLKALTTKSADKNTTEESTVPVPTVPVEKTESAASLSPAPWSKTVANIDQPLAAPVSKTVASATLVRPVSKTGGSAAPTPPVPTSKTGVSIASILPAPVSRTGVSIASLRPVPKFNSRSSTATIPPVSKTGMSTASVPPVSKTGMSTASVPPVSKTGMSTASVTQTPVSKTKSHETISQLKNQRSSTSRWSPMQTPTTANTPQSNYSPQVTSSSSVQIPRFTPQTTAAANSSQPYSQPQVTSGSSLHVPRFTPQTTTTANSSQSYYSPQVTSSSSSPVPYFAPQTTVSTPQSYYQPQVTSSSSLTPHSSPLTSDSLPFYGTAGQQTQYSYSAVQETKVVYEAAPQINKQGTSKISSNSTSSGSQPYYLTHGSTSSTPQAPFFSRPPPPLPRPHPRPALEAPPYKASVPAPLRNPPPRMPAHLRQPSLPSPASPQSQSALKFHPQNQKEDADKKIFKTPSSVPLLKTDNKPKKIQFSIITANKSKQPKIVPSNPLVQKKTTSSEDQDQTESEKPPNSAKETSEAVRESSSSSYFEKKSKAKKEDITPQSWLYFRQLLIKLNEQIEILQSGGDKFRLIGLFKRLENAFPKTNDITIDEQLQLKDIMGLLHKFLKYLPSNQLSKIIWEILTTLKTDFKIVPEEMSTDSLSSPADNADFSNIKTTETYLPRMKAHNEVEKQNSQSCEKWGKERREPEKREQEKRELDRRDWGKRDSEKREPERQDRGKRESERYERDRRDRERRSPERRNKDRRSPERRDRDRRSPERRDRERRSPEKRERESSSSGKNTYYSKYHSQETQSRRDLNKANNQPISVSSTQEEKQGNTSSEVCNENITSSQKIHSEVKQQMQSVSASKGELRKIVDLLHAALKSATNSLENNSVKLELSKIAQLLEHALPIGVEVSEENKSQFLIVLEVLEQALQRNISALGQKSTLLTSTVSLLKNSIITTSLNTSVNESINTSLSFTNKTSFAQMSPITKTHNTPNQFPETKLDFKSRESPETKHLPETKSKNEDEDQQSKLIVKITQVLQKALKTFADTMETGTIKTQLIVIAQSLEEAASKSGTTTEKEKSSLLKIIELLEKLLTISQPSSNNQSRDKIFGIMEKLKFVLEKKLGGSTPSVQQNVPKPDTPNVQHNVSKPFDKSQTPATSVQTVNTPSNQHQPQLVLQMIQLLQKALQSYCSSVEEGYLKSQLTQISQMLDRELKEHMNTMTAEQLTKQISPLVQLLHQLLKNQPASNSAAKQLVQILEQIENSLNRPVATNPLNSQPTNLVGNLQQLQMLNLQQQMQGGLQLGMGLPFQQMPMQAAPIAGSMLQLQMMQLMQQMQAAMSSQAQQPANPMNNQLSQLSQQLQTLQQQFAQVSQMTQQQPLQTSSAQQNPMLQQFTATGPQSLLQPPAMNQSQPSLSDLMFQLQQAEHQRK